MFCLGFRFMEVFWGTEFLWICDKNPVLTQAALTPLSEVALALIEMMIASTVKANTYWPLTLCEEQRESFTLISASNAHNPMKTVVNFLSDR